MQLARADVSRQRFYSMSAQIQRERNAYYDILEKTQKGNLDITKWLLWFIECLDRAISLSEENLSGVTQKAKFWESHQVVALNERQRKMLNKLMDGFEGKLTSSMWAKIMKCSPDTALRDIQDLIWEGNFGKGRRWRKEYKLPNYHNNLIQYVSGFKKRYCRKRF